MFRLDIPRPLLAALPRGALCAGWDTRFCADVARWCAMSTVLVFLRVRLRQPSTIGGIVAFIAALCGVAIDAAVQAIAAGVVVLLGLVAIRGDAAIGVLRDSDAPATAPASSVAGLGPRAHCERHDDL